jgi:hypothetical protein
LRRPGGADAEAKTVLDLPPYDELIADCDPPRGVDGLVSGHLLPCASGG